jgi:hypothetical protein
METIVAELASLGSGCLVMLRCRRRRRRDQGHCLGRLQGGLQRTGPGFREIERIQGDDVVGRHQRRGQTHRRRRTVDLAIIAGPAIEALIEEGKLVAGSGVDLAKSGIGVAVRSGAPHVDISSGEAVKAALLGAKSIAYSTGPSGVYIAALLQKWGSPIS